jgi:hypothetical protein
VRGPILRRSAWLSAAALLTLWLAPSGAPADERLPSKERVTILLTVLSYDTNIDRFQGTGLRIGVGGKTDNPASTQDAKEMLEQLRSVSTKTVKSHAIQGFPVNVTSAADLTKAAVDLNLNVLYLCSGLGGLQDQLIAVASERGMLVLAGETDAVKAGAAIGAVAKDAKPKILVNLKAADAQGAKLDARILRLAMVVQ